jgi:hypothetical protein
MPSVGALVADVVDANFGARTILDRFIARYVGRTENRHLAVVRFDSSAGPARTTAFGGAEIQSRSILTANGFVPFELRRSEGITLQHYISPLE